MAVESIFAPLFIEMKKKRAFYLYFAGKFIPLHRNSMECPDGGIGRRAGLKHQWSNIHPGSTPGLGTKIRAKYLQIKYLALIFLYICSRIVPKHPLQKEYSFKI